MLNPRGPNFLLSSMFPWKKQSDSNKDLNSATCGQGGREKRCLGWEESFLDGVTSCWDLAEELCQFSSANWSLERWKPQSGCCAGEGCGPLPGLKRAVGVLCQGSAILLLLFLKVKLPTGSSQSRCGLMRNTTRRFLAQESSSGEEDPCLERCNIQVESIHWSRHGLGTANQSTTWVSPWGKNSRSHH